MNRGRPETNEYWFFGTPSRGFWEYNMETKALLNRSYIVCLSM